MELIFLPTWKSPQADKIKMKEEFQKVAFAPFQQLFGAAQPPRAHLGTSGQQSLHLLPIL